MRAIIVDDEPRAIALLQGYLHHFRAIELAGTFRNGLKALEFLNEDAVDLVFLDIDMPHLSGISLSRLLPAGTRVIFTTAHADYAVESYEVEAVDYLLKPISLERFSRAVNRLLRQETATIPEGDRLSLRSGSDTFLVAPAEIAYLEKDGNYMTYHLLSGRRILTRQSVAGALEQLPASFVQNHKSFVINLEQVQRFSREEVCIGEAKLPIGGSFREELLQRLG